MRYKIGSFNLRNLSKNTITKRDFCKIADIIRSEQFDVVAFQEILSEGYALEYMVKFYLPGWKIRYKIPRESTDYLKSRDNRGEGYAFLWNTKRLKLASSLVENGERIFEPRIINQELHLDCGIFARCPMYARFEPVNGGFFEFRLINIHMHFGDNTKTEIEKRKEEYNFLLEKIYPRISTERKYGNNRESYTIVLGDYNLNLYKPRGEAEKRINKNTYIDAIKQVGTQRIITIQDELTTLKSVQVDESLEEERFETEVTPENNKFIRKIVNNKYFRKEDDETIDNNPNRGYSQNYDHFSFDVDMFIREGIRYKGKRIDAVRKYCDDDFEMYRMEISDHIPISLEIIMNEQRG